MSYLGENISFSFRDGFCESLPGISINSSDAADFGRKTAPFFRRFAVGCSNEKLRHILYSLCAGIAECGKDVFLCENTEMPPFRFGLPLVDCDCGIFLSGGPELRISFFNGNGFPAGRQLMKSIMERQETEISSDCGKITNISSFEKIYINNIKDMLNDSELPLCAGISCGNRGIRALWQEFFDDADDTLIFQISDDGQRVNAYSTELGFISHERLILTYCIMLSKKGEEIIWLPEKFHYAAENTVLSHGLCLKKFDPDKYIPEDAVRQRFLSDPLYMCTQLASDRDSFYSAISEVPKFTSAKREVCINTNCQIPYDKAIIEPKGKIYISRSGKDRVSLLAQAFDTETAAEICSGWQEKLRRYSSCSGTSF